MRTMLLAAVWSSASVAVFNAARAYFRFRRTKRAHDLYVRSLHARALHTDGRPMPLPDHVVVEIVQALRDDRSIE